MQSQMMLCAFKKAPLESGSVKPVSTRARGKSQNLELLSMARTLLEQTVLLLLLNWSNQRGKHRYQRSMLGEKTAISTGTHIKRRRPLSWSDSSHTDGQCQPDKNQEPSSWICLCMLHPGPVELHTHLHMNAHTRRHTQRTLLRTNSLLNSATSH